MPRLSKKTSKELEAEYKTKVSHAIQKLDSWFGKTVKLAVKGKKYKLADAQREQILTHIAGSYSDFVEEMQSRKVSAKAFELEGVIEAKVSKPKETVTPSKETLRIIKK